MVGVVIFAVLLVVWGVSTHGFRDMRSYNLGYNAGVMDMRGTYRGGCLTMLSLAHTSSDAPGLDDADFLAGCRAAGDPYFGGYN